MRTRIVTCATLEGECIWYSEIIFLVHLMSRKALKAFFFYLEDMGAGVEMSENLKTFIELILCSVLGQIFLINLIC